MILSLEDAEDTISLNCRTCEGKQVWNIVEERKDCSGFRTSYRNTSEFLSCLQFNMIIKKVKD